MNQWQHSEDALPGLSIIIPTRNSESTLEACLLSISGQSYPKHKLQIILADADSTDNTQRIIKQFAQSLPLLCVSNPLKTGESGKAVALRHCSHEIIVFIDSDNILPDNQWLMKMVQPFADSSIIAAEPLNYTYREQDGYITRYCALLGMNDPLCLFLGNYDRFCWLTRTWTGLRHREEDKGSYLQVSFLENKLPTIGANGFLIRASSLRKCEITDYLFDIDILQRLLQLDPTLTIAKVKTGIIHIYARSAGVFLKKQLRRARDYIFLREKGIRTYSWHRHSKTRIAYFILSSLLVLPLVIQASCGYVKKNDWAWFFHVPACLITLFVYATLFIANTFSPLPEYKR